MIIGVEKSEKEKCCYYNMYSAFCYIYWYR